MVFLHSQATTCTWSLSSLPLRLCPLQLTPSRRFLLQTFPSSVQMHRHCFQREKAKNLLDSTFSPATSCFSAPLFSTTSGKNCLVLCLHPPTRTQIHFSQAFVLTLLSKPCLLMTPVLVFTALLRAFPRPLISCSVKSHCVHCSAAPPIASLSRCLSPPCSLGHSHTRDWLALKGTLPSCPCSWNTSPRWLPPSLPSS